MSAVQLDGQALAVYPWPVDLEAEAAATRAMILALDGTVVRMNGRDYEVFDMIEDEMGIHATFSQIKPSTGLAP